MRTATRALVPGCIALFLILWASPLNAKARDMSGTWTLEDGDGSGLPGPKGVVIVKIVHKEPALKYSITGTDSEGKPMNFGFDGAIDGKPYKDTGPDGGTTTWKRIDDSTLEGTSTSANGKTTETFTLTVSKSGKVFTRKGTVKIPEGEKVPAGEYKYWEVWEKQ